MARSIQRAGVRVSGSGVSLQSNLPSIANEMKLTVPKALQFGAEAIAQEAKERVPVRTGALRDAIHVEKRSSSGRVGGGYYADWHVVAGNSKVFYGHMVEHGTTRAAPRPFLIPAFEARRAVVEGAVRTALSRLGKRGQGVRLDIG